MFIVCTNIWTWRFLICTSGPYNAVRQTKFVFCLVWQIFCQRATRTFISPYIRFWSDRHRTGWYMIKFHASIPEIGLFKKNQSHGCVIIMYTRFRFWVKWKMCIVFIMMCTFFYVWESGDTFFFFFLWVEIMVPDYLDNNSLENLISIVLIALWLNKFCNFQIIFLRNWKRATRKTTEIRK